MWVGDTWLQLVTHNGTQGSREEEGEAGHAGNGRRGSETPRQVARFPGDEGVLKKFLRKHEGLQVWREPLMDLRRGAERVILEVCCNKDSMLACVCHSILARCTLV